ncbi:mitochondrial potassium channel ATP-binding subunit isoform X3 [Cherax quadricarinatus]|uniref:mitochondrial potassium channel ATP-binding subunit isoform X3 n=1 Tax=Cherax quadricarinatus TaxID=27406 RepID=UPI00387E419A
MMLWRYASRLTQVPALTRQRLPCISPPGQSIHLKLFNGNKGNLRTLFNETLVHQVHLTRGQAVASHDGYSISFIIKLALGGGALLSVKVLTTPLKVDCKVNQPTQEIRDRLHGTESSEDSVDPPFDWLAFWQLLKPQLHYFLAAMVSALIVALANVHIPLLLGDVVNVVAKFTRETENEGRSYMQEIYVPSVKLIKYCVAQAIFTFSYITFLTRMGERMADSLRQQLFTALLEQDIAFYDQHKTGELVNRLTADVQDFKSSFKMCISQGLRSITQVGRATGVADECLSNMRTVRAFAMEDAERDLFAREVEKSRQLNERLGFGIGFFQAGSNLFLNGIVIGTLYAGGKLMSTNQMKPGDLMSFLAACQTIQRSLAQLGILFGTYVRGISAGARVFEFIKLEQTIPIRGGKKIPYHSLMGNIEFRNVSFAYPTRCDQEVLHDFSLHIPAGKVVALVGVSGGGKSTVAQLLERFYDVKSGSIMLDGVDLRTLDPSWLRGRVIGFINQEPVLFATSIMENIRYGYPEATDAEVIAAAKTANAHEFVESFPRGYNTVVGERGVTVSGGQKQRIAIARALLKNPRILVLDEATSALDAESEGVVQAALENCIEGRTVLIIAHRLSTIQNADVIAVMSHGKLAEIGTHHQLKKLGGIYADLIQQQQKEEKTASKRFWWI